MPWGSKMPLSTVMASATASPAGTFSMASAASPDTRAASSGPPAVALCSLAQVRQRALGLKAYQCRCYIYMYCVAIHFQTVMQLQSWPNTKHTFCVIHKSFDGLLGPKTATKTASGG